MRPNLNELPSNLPKPIDDGKTNHLRGFKIPHIKLQSTNGHPIDLQDACKESVVLFIYPRAGSPLEQNNDPELWDSIPGARGCTPQSCGFRDLTNEFLSLGVKIYGLSIQSPIIQKEFVERNHIRFPILSDYQYEFTIKLNLPTFDFQGQRLIKRMAFFIKNNKIEKIFYPIFPPDKNAEAVLSWLAAQD